jgi:V/A-type H+/Na+-transporting ATPase subunit C
LSQEQLYSTVLVKVGAERSYLLSKEKLERLADCKTLEEFASELRETVYGKKLAKVTLPYTSRNFERLFRESLIEVAIKIVRSSPEVASSFLKTYLLKFEHENIKTILRAASIGLSSDEITSKLYLPVEKFLKRQEIISKAAMAIHVKSVVDVLKTTFYSSSLLFGLQKYEETGSTKYFDILLDRMFYEQFGETFRELPKKEQEHIFFYVSRETDKFNILTILRAKLLGYEPHWIRMAISRNSYNVLGQTIESMLMADDFDSVFSIIMQSYYKNLFVKAETPEETISAAEKAFRRDIFERAKKTKVGDTFNVGTPMSFMVNKEIELYNLTAISLGIEYNWKKDDISRLLLF